MEIAVVGGGAAGFFAALTVKENYPEAEVVIYEKTDKLLTKVKISGGGRCNLTNNCSSLKELTDSYPRGGRYLKKAFGIFNNVHAMQWFESRGVPLVIQDDKCVFPRSQNSLSIVNCFLEHAKINGITIEMDRGIKAISRIGDKLEVIFFAEEVPARIFNKIIITSGGSSNRKAYEWLAALGHKIEDPVPSLFTFNMPDESIIQLMGVVVEKAQVRIQGTNLKTDGPVLITHWGMSGPAILKLSSLGARLLKEKVYEFKIQVNWINIKDHELILDKLRSFANEHHNKVLSGIKPFLLPDRLWRYLLEKCEIPLTKKWAELGRKNLHRLVNVLMNDVYSVKGKTTFKKEFVTCGGVSLDDIELTTMQSRVCKNLYFAGEVLDIDGITGGYNFQAAWTTAFIAGKLS